MCTNSRFSVLYTNCFSVFSLVQINLCNSTVKVPLCFASQNKGGMWKELSKMFGRRLVRMFGRKITTFNSFLMHLFF